MTKMEEVTMIAIQQMSKKISEVDLRDLFAMNAMQMFYRGTNFTGKHYDELAESSYQLADAMLIARGKNGTSKT